MDPENERALEIIGAAHAQIADFARSGYSHDGRGVIQIRIPRLPRGAYHVIVATDMTYTALDEVVRLAFDISEHARDDVDVLIRMLRTYDPTQQAVVTVVVDGRNPVTVKMKLHHPNLVGEADGVH